MRSLSTTLISLTALAVLFASAFLFACTHRVQADATPGQDQDSAVPDLPEAAAPDAVVDSGPPKPPLLPPPGAGFTCDVKALLATKCQVCHADPPQAGALVPLMTVPQFFNWSKEDPSKTVGQMVLAKILDPAAPMPPAFFNNALTPDEVQTVQAWAQANFVGGCYGSAPPSASCTTCHGDDTRVGIAGADSNIKVSPPKGTNGEVDTGARAVGAHQAHVNQSDLTAAPLACKDCHVVPTSNSHSNGVVDVVFGAISKAAGASPVWNGTSCTNAYCHGNFPGGVTTATPSWTGGPMTCGACHGTPPSTPPHTNPAAACSLCHGAGYSATAKTVNKAKHINGIVDTDESGLNCASCHGDSTRTVVAGADANLKSSPPIGSKGETLTSTRAVGAHQSHVNKADLINLPLKCADCHIVPTSTSHSNGVVDIAFGALAKTGGANATWNGTTCAGMYCHGSFTGGAAAVPTWTAGTGATLACDSCHGAPPATSPHTNPSPECSLCHGTGYSATAKTVAKATHIDGVFTVSTSNLTCSSCHGDGTRTGIAGADPEVKSAPPVGTHSETATSTRAVGAHQAHLNKGTFSTPIACAECHAVPDSMNHSNGVVDMAFGALSKTNGAAPTWNGTTCAGSYCHGKFTGGLAAAPTWTTAGTVACASCHALPPPTSPHTNPAAPCSNCHGAGYSATSQTVNKTTHINGVVETDTTTLTCSSCHGDGTRTAVAGADPNEKASPPVGSKGESATSTRAVGAHVAHVNTNTLSAPIACNECHVVPISNSHSNGVVDMSFGTLANTLGAVTAWNGTTCTGSYCHGNFAGGLTTAAPSWTGGAVSCDACHGLPPATPPHSNPALACSLCHGTGFSATAQTVNATIHINGLVDVDQSALSCTSCHGDGTRPGITGADPRQISAPPLGTHGETASTTLAVGAHLPHLNQATYADTPIMCNDCHAVPTSNLHSDGIVQVTFGAFAKTGGAAPTWNGTTCSSVYCHGAFTGGSTTFQPNWTAGTVTCGSCHTTPPSSGKHGDHRGRPCSDCHGTGYAYSATTATVSPTLHLNGVNDTAGPKITSYNATTKSCTTASGCHNSAMTW